MPMLLPTFSEIVATQFKRTGYCLVFNRGFNDICAFDRESDSFPSQDDTDQVAREEFLDFMKTHFPEFKLHRVFDDVPLSFLCWPYLGSIALDLEEGSEVYNALAKKYGDPTQAATCNNAVFWVLKVDVATSLHDARLQSIRQCEEADDLGGSDAKS